METSHLIHLHHSGNFGKRNKYVGGDLELFDDVDSDTMSYIELQGMLKSLHLNAHGKIFYMDPIHGHLLQVFNDLSVMAMFETYNFNIPLIHIYVSKPNEAVRSMEEEVDTDIDSVFNAKNQNVNSDGNAKNQNVNSDGNAKNQNVENKNADSDDNAENHNAENDEFGNIKVDDEELDDVSLYAPSDELWNIHSESDDEEINSAPKQPKTKIARDEEQRIGYRHKVCEC
ncbi:uncharacterized protein LOC132304591 [Cornus florida]|uniref:uncharacterized protein LOC132304591 n=1 Tax=Cornus florida TaxID=4283 RepID=UPI00289F8614|nr:uncharacterized protein LOC132304591 [Cornus florida]